MTTRRDLELEKERLERIAEETAREADAALEAFKQAQADLNEFNEKARKLLKLMAELGPHG